MQFNTTTSSTTSRLKSRSVFPLASSISTTTWILSIPGFFIHVHGLLDPLQHSTFNPGPLVDRIVILVTFRICIILGRARRKMIFDNRCITIINKSRNAFDFRSFVAIILVSLYYYITFMVRELMFLYDGGISAETLSFEGATWWFTQPPPCVGSMMNIPCFRSTLLYNGYNCVDIIIVW
jgi:hypothetical protein